MNKRIGSAVVTPAGPNYAQDIATGGFDLVHEGRAFIGRVHSTAATLSAGQWDKLIEIAGKTPVTMTLAAGAEITTTRAGP